MSDENFAPRLRPVDVRRITHQGEAFFYLRDPLELAGRELLVPVALGPLLMLLDGTRSLARIRVELMMRYGVALDPDRLAELVGTLSDACLLDDEVSAAALRRARDDYRAAAYRTPAHADRVYPGNPSELRARLRDFERRSHAAESETNGVVGLISPHIDYTRGGPLYAGLWRRAAPALREADVAVIFGTDHTGGPGRLTLTRQSYATPFGVLPANLEAVDAMAAALGEDAAFEEELHHRGEHSVELAAVWLHHVRDGVPCTVIPVLCGHPMPFMEGVAGSESGFGAGTLAEHTGWQAVNQALGALREATAGRRVVAIAAADLAHVGPAFGDPEPFSPLAKQKVRFADEELIDAMNTGPEAVLGAAARIDDRYRICGLSPIALTLAFTGPVTAEVTGYDQCPADHDGGDGSIVSIAGVILRQA